MTNPFKVEAPMFIVIDKYNNTFVVNEYELRNIQFQILKKNPDATPFVNSNVLALSNESIDTETNRMATILENGSLSNCLKGLMITMNLEFELLRLKAK